MEEYLSTESSSPVSELSSRMQGLLCLDSLTPRRRLSLSPELNKGEETQHQLETETPTVSALYTNTHQSKMPGCLTPRKHQEDEKENSDVRISAAAKRVRVRLFSKAGVDDEEPEMVCRNKRQCASLPEETLFHHDADKLDPTSALLFQRLRSRRKLSSTPVPDSALTDSRLIGDFSKQHVLPVEKVDHQDLHCISAQTMAALIRGQFSSAVEEFLIVDCRYPYEYQGGHIKGAVNLHTESQIRQAVLQGPSSNHEPRRSATPGPATWGRATQGTQAHGRAGGVTQEAASPRKLMVFHCEFSSERGPHLCQYVRELDRTLNAQVYPLLHYPEIYLLQGGYKHFYTCFPELCDPCGYVPMRHKAFREQLRRFSRTRRSHHRRRPIRLQQRAARFYLGRPRPDLS